MYKFANDKCVHYISIWTEFALLNFYFGIATGLWFVLYQVANMFGKSEAQILAPNMTVLSVLFYLSNLYGALDTSIATAAIIGISILQSFRKLSSVVNQIC